jgi:hypothetical protein
MPAGILGSLWRVSLLGVGFTAAMFAIGAAWTGAHAGSVAEILPSLVAGFVL